MTVRKYDIHNPTQARRVIFDGVEGRQTKITLQPGETKSGVELAEHIAAKFGTNVTDPDKKNLWVKPSGEPDVEAQMQTSAPRALPDGYVPYKAPPVVPPKKAKAKSKAA